MRNGIKLALAALAVNAMIATLMTNLLSKKMDSLSLRSPMQGDDALLGDPPHSPDGSSIAKQVHDDAHIAAGPHLPTESADHVEQGWAKAPEPVSPEAVRRNPISYASAMLDARLGNLMPLPASDVVRCCKVLVELELRTYHLSRIEKQVAKGILSSHSNQSIGDELFLSLSMVKYHVRNIFRKTKCSNRNMFVKLIFEGVASSDHTWRDRVDLDRDMERLRLI